MVTIEPKNGVTGTYGFNFFARSYPSMEACGPYFLLVVGNGLPDYGFMPKSCQSAPTNQGYTTNSVGLVDGFLFVEISGIANGLVTFACSGGSTTVSPSYSIATVHCW